MSSVESCSNLSRTSNTFLSIFESIVERCGDKIFFELENALSTLTCAAGIRIIRKQVCTTLEIGAFGFSNISKCFHLSLSVALVEKSLSRC